MIAYIQKGDFFAAWRVVLQDSPLPGVCGRVCYYPCEGKCSRSELDKPVAIHLLERFAFDQGYQPGFIDPYIRKNLGRKKERVAVVGSGPAGLTCAYHLARLGYKVTVFERDEKPGGLLRYGIPEYRLPRRILDREIALISAHGVEFKTGYTLGGNLALENLKNFDAAFLALGAHKPREVPLGVGKGDNGVWNGLEFLYNVSRGSRSLPGRKVAVVGGGNTAVDTARVIRRLGGEAVIVYRRTEEEMPAHPREIEAAKEESIKLEFLLSPVSVLTGDGGIMGLRCQRMTLGEPGADGRRQPLPVANSFVTVEADSVVMAVGEEPELDGLPREMVGENGYVVVDDRFMTTVPGLFAGGDAVSGAGTVVSAIAQGKEAARQIDIYLGGEGVVGTGLGSEAKLNLGKGYFEREDRLGEREVDPREAVKDFREVSLGLDKIRALMEAERCFSCGVCNGCGICYIYCPDAAIVRDGETYRVLYDYCKGCGICAEECPRNVIDMEEESKWPT